MNINIHERDVSSLTRRVTPQGSLLVTNGVLSGLLGLLLGLLLELLSGLLSGLFGLLFGLSGL